MARFCPPERPDPDAWLLTLVDDDGNETGPAKRTWLAGWTITSAADHLEAQGWKVRRWEGGARAWRINLRPVRRFRRIEYAKELFRKQGRKNLSNDALLFDYPA